LVIENSNNIIQDFKVDFCRYYANIQIKSKLYGALNYLFIFDKTQPTTAIQDLQNRKRKFVLQSFVEKLCDSLTNR
jgi:hypothetical protein